MKAITCRLKNRYDRYKAGYLRHLHKLGYGDHKGDFDLFFIKHAFILCWAKPGFHYFWRYWNPGIGYMTYRLYHTLGGNRRRISAILVTFLVNGLVHNLVLSPFLGWSFTLPAAFLCFGIFSIVMEKVQFLLQQDMWYWPFNALLNISLVVLCFDLGFRINDFLFQMLV